MALGQLTRLARQHRKDLKDAEVQRVVDRRPPRIEVKRVPALAPIPQPADPRWGMGAEWREIELSACKRCGETQRPNHRVVCVPILPPSVPIVMGTDARLAEQITYSQARFQPIQYALQISHPAGGGTRVSWWGWEHCEEVTKPEVRRGLNRALAYSGEMRIAFDRIFGPKGSTPDFGWDRLAAERWAGWPIETLREWLDVIIEDAEQALGRP